MESSDDSRKADNVEERSTETNDQAIQSSEKSTGTVNIFLKQASEMKPSVDEIFSKCMFMLTQINEDIDILISDAENVKLETAKISEWMNTVYDADQSFFDIFDMEPGAYQQLVDNEIARSSMYDDAIVAEVIHYSQRELIKSDENKAKEMAGGEHSRWLEPIFEEGECSGISGANAGIKLTFDELYNDSEDDD